MGGTATLNRRMVPWTAITINAAARSRIANVGVTGILTTSWIPNANLPTGRTPNAPITAKKTGASASLSVKVNGP